MERDGLYEDMKFDDDLEGFYSGGGTGTVNFQPKPMPMSFGSPLEEEQPKAEGSATTVGAAAAAAAATAGAAASAVIGGNFSAAQGIVGGVVGNVMDTVVSASVPTSLQPVKEQAGRFLQKARPWCEFLLPLSVPSASEGCTRLTANIYSFQTNYAILFVLQLVFAIVFHPSALICIIIVVIVWVVFLKKNDDPDWAPMIGGVTLGPIQRLLLLAMVTALTLFFVAGSAIFNTIWLYVLFVLVHGVVHDPSAKGIPGNGSGNVEL